jgi:hypothetical protein
MTVRPFNPELPTDYRGRQIRDTEDFERNQFIRRGATTDTNGAVKVPRSWKNSLGNAALGALRGITTTGSLGGALGGALAGGVGATISPLRGKEAIFEAFQAPGIRAGIEKRQAEDELRRKQALDDLKRQEAEADIRLKDAQRIKTLTPPLTRPRTPQLKLGKNRETGEVRYFDPLDPAQATMFEPTQFQRPQAEKKPSSAELGVDPDSGLSAEEMARASYENRGGDQYVLSRLPADVQQIINTGKVIRDGKERNATSEEMKNARAELDRAIKRQLDADMQFSKGHIRSKRVAPLSRPGGAKPGASGLKRNVNELPPLR